MSVFRVFEAFALKGKIKKIMEQFELTLNYEFIIIFFELSQIKSLDFFIKHDQCIKYHNNKQILSIQMILLKLDILMKSVKVKQKFLIWDCV